MKEAQPTPAPESEGSKKPSEAKNKQWPDETTTKELARDTYTVQVFATKDKDKADRIVRSLRQQQFDSYLAEAKIGNQVLYRVRVGKKSKVKIEKMNKELQKVIGGMGMKSRIIKIK